MPAIDDLIARAEKALSEHPEAGAADFGWLLHRHTQGQPHLLVSCEPDASWRTMPGPAVRTAIAQHLGMYAVALAEAGLGVVAWDHGGQTGALIVARTPAEAEAQAGPIRDHLTTHNKRGN